MARAAAAVGVETIVATPHVSSRYAPAARDIRATAAELIVELAAQDIVMSVVTGAELSIAKALELDDEELAALRLGGGPYLLVECPLGEEEDAEDVAARLRAVRERGHPLVLAHPERAPAFMREIGCLRRLVADGMLVSVTAGALTGGFGHERRLFATRLVREGLVHDVASDAHNHTDRSHYSLLQSAQDKWYTRDAPAAILAGRPVTRPDSPVQRAS